MILSRLRQNINTSVSLSDKIIDLGLYEIINLYPVQSWIWPNATFLSTNDVL